MACGTFSHAEASATYNIKDIDMSRKQLHIPPGKGPQDRYVRLGDLLDNVV